MHLDSLSLVNFKNYALAELEFSPKINCFTGNNGAGKTNLLDAIYYLSFCKSYLNPIDSQNIKHEQDFFVIQGTYQRKDKPENIYCGLKRNQKKNFKRNTKGYKKLSEHIGLLPTVMISPYDTALITGGSDERRRFMDSVIAQYDRSYLDSLIRYNRALAQRNALLKEFAKKQRTDLTMLEVWDQQLITNGQNIHAARVTFIQQLQPIFQHYYEFVSHRNEAVSLAYKSTLHNNDFAAQLSEAYEKDRSMQFSTVGSHKDDLELKLGNYPMKKLGSQGQQKTFLVALKLAQFDFMKQVNGFSPTLLLDDIFDKLDAQRVTQIVKLVSDNNFGQIFITDTSSVRLKDIVAQITVEHSFFEIHAGEVNARQL